MPILKQHFPPSVHIKLLFSSSVSNEYELQSVDMTAAVLLSLQGIDWNLAEQKP